jgi:hypothetical protein
VKRREKQRKREREREIDNKQQEEACGIGWWRQTL